MIGISISVLYGGHEERLQIVYI